MILGEHVLLRVAIAVLGLCGFYVAKHIRKHKKAGSPLVCPIRFDCNTVVNSDYSKFFGIPLEILGMLYYGIIFISYTISLALFYFAEISPSQLVIAFMITLSVIAFLFSLYLVSVLFFVLKKGCSWCFVSAAISVTIFILTVYTYNLNSVVQSLT